MEVKRDDVEHAYFSAGAALALLGGLAQENAPVGGLWRQRLALGAAVVIAHREGLREGEAGLRDAVAFCQPGEDPGPAGRLYLNWRVLAEPRALDCAKWSLELPSLFDLPPKPLTDLLADIAAGMVGAAAPLSYAAQGAGRIAALGSRYRGLSLWIGDALLARALGWARPVPILATHLPSRAFLLQGQAWNVACAQAWGKGALSAFDLYHDLQRRAGALEGAKLRRPGKDAVTIFGQLLTQDAIAPQAGPEASVRAARRMFDRLTALGLVRELTGRSSFRLYGL